MCLAIPGKIEELINNNLGMKYAIVSFGGIKKEICIEMVPGASVGDYIIAHAGIALNKLDEDEAAKTLSLIDEIALYNNETEQESGSSQ